MDDFREQKRALDGLGAQSVDISRKDDLFPLHQEIFNGRIHLTDPYTWVYSSSIATYSGVGWDLVPFNFWWIYINGYQPEI